MTSPNRRDLREQEVDAAWWLAINEFATLTAGLGGCTSRSQEDADRHGRYRATQDAYRAFG